METRRSSAAPDELRRPDADPSTPSTHLERVVDEVVERVGPRIGLATPLGIGKPNQLVDAFYRRARSDSGLELRIFTALSLARPGWSSELERRFLEPILDRVFRDYPELEFARDHVEGRLPANVRVTSFYYQPGSALHSPSAQRSHVNVNYTHVVRDVIEAGVNVLAQMVAPSPPDGDPDDVSLGSNPDLTLDLLPHLVARREAGEPVAILAQVNRNMPFMYGDAVVDREVFDHVVDDPALDFTLFAPPSRPVTDAEWALGLNASALVRDGGTLQLGIGALGDAVSRLLLLRHHHNPTYRRLLDATGLPARQGALLDRLGGAEPFDEGLYGCSEMLMQGLLELLEGGVLTRQAEDGNVLHACFFLGPGDFYRDLRQLPAHARRRICMTRISFVNQLFGQEDRKRRERRHARFLNTGMVATLLGAVASDGLEDGRVVSGVGGQYNFVAMAHELAQARSVLMVRAVRTSGGEARSNIRFSYGHTTIPRHLRDVLVTEYGIADLRGRSDRQVVEAMLAVADSRFQDALVDEAKEAGKLPADYRIPERFRGNTPERITEALAPFRADETLSDYPFGTDLTGPEQELSRGLRHLKRSLSGNLDLPELDDLVKTLDVPEELAPHLERMGLAEPETLEERVMRRAVVYGLAAADVV